MKQKFTVTSFVSVNLHLIEIKICSETDVQFSLQ